LRGYEVSEAISLLTKSVVHRDCHVRLGRSRNGKGLQKTVEIN